MSPSFLKPGRLPDAARVLLLTMFAGTILAWHVVHTEILYADGLRYITQAREIERGDVAGAIRKAVDHPVYPLAILGTWRALQRSDDADGWQVAAQIASATAGVLLVLPLYLIARRLVGRSGAWQGVLLVYLVPLPSRIMGDALSEGAFLLFWSWGFWAALRHLKHGSTRWLVVALILGVVSYLVRPEGLLLPLALAGTLVLSPISSLTRLPAARWWRGIACLVLGASALVGPFIAFKGGIGTKPAVARLLGIAPPSPPDAVERERPLNPDQSPLQTSTLAARSAFQAIRHAVTSPLLVLAALGLTARWLRSGKVEARNWLFLNIIFGGSYLALMRLHATGGYCTPRHALLVALPLIVASASGARVIAAILSSQSRRRFGLSTRIFAILTPGLVLLVLGVANERALLSPLNAGKGAYRDAGRWLRRNTAEDARVVDVTGWSLFYGGRTGYTFANLHDADHDPALSWIVVRDAHLRGPWTYCERLRNLVRSASLVARFPSGEHRGSTRVSVYRLQERPITANAPGPDRR